MLPESLLSYETAGGAVAPHYLTAADHPWLRVLLDEHERFVGRPRRALAERLRDSLGPGVPYARQQIAAHVLGRLAGRAARPGLSPRAARAALFGAAAAAGAGAGAGTGAGTGAGAGAGADAGAGAGAAPARGVVVAQAARALGTTPAELEAALFADLPGEAPVAALAAPLAPAELALRANLALLQALLARALSVTIDVEGHARALVRVARLRGLICTVRPTPPAGARLALSGPFALFRHTLLYGRALASVVPHLAWSRRFVLRAECRLRGRDLVLAARTGDPFLPAEEPRGYDSALEARFARDFRRLAPAWDLVHEPEPVRAGGALVFPDFAVSERRDPRRRYLVEIVGFWTPAYLEQKLAALAAARLANLVVCVDEARQCQAGEMPAGAAVVRYRGRIDPAAVLEAIEALAA